jgi:hypothetical protein
MVTWELTIEHDFSWEFYDKLVGRTGSEVTKAGFCMRESCLALEKLLRPQGLTKNDEPSFIPCDLIAAAVCVDYSIVKKSINKFVSIEL